MTILAIDPGTRESAFVEFDHAGCGERSSIIQHAKVSNYAILTMLRCHTPTKTHVLIIEAMACYGKPIGQETIETAIWSGRFVEAFDARAGVWDRLLRKDIKKHVCGSAKSGDPDVRRGLIQHFGGDTAIGNKRSPGPLYGIKGDEWAALAVAVAYAHGVRSVIKT